MGSLLAGFTTRGRAFIAAGVAAGILGLALGQRTLLSIGGLLVILPVLAHRLLPSAEAVVTRQPPEQVLAAIVDRVPLPQLR